MQRIEKVVAGAGLTVAAIILAVHAGGFGSWAFQVSVYRGAAPVLTAVAAWLFWRGFVRAELPGVRRYAFLTGAGLAMLTLSQTYNLGRLFAVGDVSYPGTAPFVQVTTLLSLVLGLAGLLAVPVRARWSTSRLRLGLDMLTVLAAGATFLWYFVIEPGLSPEHGTLVPVLALAQTTGALVMLFAIARLVLGGVAEVSRRALALSAAVGVTDVVLQLLKQTVGGMAGLHLALSGWTVLVALLIAVGMALLRSTSVPAAARPETVRRRVNVLPYLAVFAAYALLVAGVRADGLSARTGVVLAGAMLLTGLVVARQVVAMRDNARLVAELDDSLHALRRSMARERILGELGTTLLTVTDQADVHRLAVGAATELLAECPGARASLVAVTAEEPDHFLVVSVAGPGAEERIGGRLPSSAVPIDLLVTLARGDVVAGPSLSALGVTGFGDPGLERPLIVMPLLNGERFFGALVVSADGDLPGDLRKSLDTLRTQLSLALDSAALTAELTNRALHDALTGLGNRALLRDRMAGALARSRRHGRPVGALLLDLNGFKQVNDVHGHDAGDDLLKVVADRLRACVRTEDTVCRLGGDEFVVIAEDLHSAADAVVIAERIVAALDEVVPVGRHLVRTPASIGIALSHVDVVSPDQLLRLADAAMYRAKAAGAGGYHLHGAGDTALVSTE